MSNLLSESPPDGGPVSHLAITRIVVPGTQHIDPARWSPLVYNFRHYFGLGPELGRTFRSELPPRGQ